MSFDLQVGGTPTEFPPPTGGNEDWNLAAGHFVSTSITGMAPVITHPRANANTDAYCKNAYNDGTYSEKWEIPIVVQGGSWPFRYQVTGPAGMSIGETLTAGVDKQTVGATYAVLSWDDPQPGSYDITVLVTDQDGNPATVTWTLVVGSAGWIFVDAQFGSDTTGDGSFLNPLQTFHTGVYEASDIAATYVNTRVVYSDGTYSIHNGTPDNNVSINENYKPRTHIAKNGHSPIWDMTTGHVKLEPCNDFYLGGIITDGYRPTTTNPKPFQIPGGTAANRQQSRITFFKNTINNIDSGTIGNSNPCWCFSAGHNGVDRRNYISFVRNTLGTTSKVGIAILYDCHNIVFEHNSADGVSFTPTNGESGVWIIAKENVNNTTIRSNHAINCTSDEAQGLIQCLNQSTPNDNQEICWNVVESEPAVTVGALCGWNRTPAGESTNTHDFRNTWINTRTAGGRAIRLLTNTNANKVRIQGNAMYATTDTIAGLLDVNYTDAGGNVDLALNDFDASGNLVDGGASATARTDNLGISGYEAA